MTAMTLGSFHGFITGRLSRGIRADIPTFGAIAGATKAVEQTGFVAAAAATKTVQNTAFVAPALPPNARMQAGPQAAPDIQTYGKNSKTRSQQYLLSKRQCIHTGWQQISLSKRQCIHSGWLQMLGICWNMLE